MKNWIVGALLALLCLTANAGGSLPAAVLAELKDADIPLSAVGIIVQPLKKQKPQLSLNANQAMNPASVMKLVTTSAALELLGPAHTWTTKAYLQGRLDQDRLDGDLLLQGSGDPKFTQEQFWLLLRQLRARGVRDIRGDLVLDRSAFAPLVQDLAFDAKPLRPYNVVPDALLLGFKSVRITLVPRDADVTLLLDPPLGDMRVSNRIRITDGGCGEWKDGLVAEQVEHEGRYELMLGGDYPKSCGEQVWALGVLSHRDFVGAVFRDLWRELGGSFGGELRDGIVPLDAVPIAAIESPPLIDLIRDINKFSNNVMARTLFLALSSERPATTSSAANAVLHWLEQKKIPAPGLVLDNGAGLSRHERIAPATLARILQHMADSPLMPEFVSSLPIVAVDGTMKKRLIDMPVAGRAHIKTGYLEGVRSIAGYVRNADGEEVMVVFLVNHANARRAQAAQDALLNWVYAH